MHHDRACRVRRLLAAFALASLAAFTPARAAGYQHTKIADSSGELDTFLTPVLGNDGYVTFVSIDDTFIIYTAGPATAAPCTPTPRPTTTSNT